MPHSGLESPTEKKRKNKIKGFNVRILDDETYVLEMQNEDYDKNKTYSYSNLDDMFKEVKKDLTHKGKNNADNLTKKE